MILRFFIFALVLFAPSLARADYFFWTDPKSGMTVTFPDTWKVQNNVGDDTVFTVMGPSEVDQPVCRIDVKDDKRYIIFPARYGDAVQKTAASTPFWKQYLAQYDDYTLGPVHDGSGLGRWFASYALASYGKHFGTVMQSRRAIMFASLYNDKMYVVECSALANGYEKWQSNFRGIIKSIDFKKAYHELPTGEYANFLNEVEMLFWSQTGPDGTTAY